MKKSPHVVVFANDRLKSAGNQLINQTIGMFVKRGLDVAWITGHPRGYYSETPLAEAFGDFSSRVEVIRPGSALSFLARQAIAMKRGRREKLAQDSDTSEAIVPDWYGQNARLDYFVSDSPLSSAIRMAAWYAYQRFAYGVAMRRIAWDKVKLVVGYEVFGAPVAALVSDTRRVPVVTKYQGTAVRGEDVKAPSASLKWYVAGLRARADLVIMENDGTQGREALLRLGHDPSRVRFWIDGINPVPRTLPRVGDPVTFLSVSTFKPWKRIDRLLLAMRKAIDLGLPDSSRLVIVGDGLEGASIRAYAAHLGITNRIEFRGALAHRGVLKCYGESSALIVCNDVSNLSNMVLESLSAGRPVITLDDSSTDGVLTPGSDCLVASIAGDIAANLARCMCAFASNAELRARLTCGAMNTGNTLETWEERMQKEWLEIARLVPEWGEREVRNGDATP